MPMIHSLNSSCHPCRTCTSRPQLAAGTVVGAGLQLGGAAGVGLQPGALTGESACLPPFRLLHTAGLCLYLGRRNHHSATVWKAGWQVLLPVVFHLRA